ncbi:MAG: 50S ribosomal protein L3 [Gammaproteobacteria bacterium]|nr:MAG: 50S ribosomal protein L3 [Gammaproteobacteria bacterium]
MTMGLIGRKCGMTQIYAENGLAIPVTLVEILPNRVVQIKTKERDGYESVQVTTDKKSSSRLSKAEAGHFAKANVEPGKGLWEFQLNDEDSEFVKDLSLGKEITVDQLFKLGTWVDVTGTNKGKGFAGVIKRHHFATQDATHGNSLSHRAPGSIGQRQSPGRVFKGKKMCGQLGNHRCTIQSLEVVKVDPERHLLHIKGSVPGAPGGHLIIKPAVRKKNKRKQG